MKNTLAKAERLSSKKWIEELYKAGSSFRIYPLKITFLNHNYLTEYPVMMMVSSPKHLFKHAHERNLTKRRMREVYRKNKHVFLENCSAENLKFFIAFQYAHKKIEPSEIIENSIKKALIKIESSFIKFSNKPSC